MANYPRKQQNLRPSKICMYTVSAQPQAAPSVLYNYTDITLYTYRYITSLEAMSVEHTES